MSHQRAGKPTLLSEWTGRLRERRTRGAASIPVHPDCESGESAAALFLDAIELHLAGHRKVNALVRDLRPDLPSYLQKDLVRYICRAENMPEILGLLRDYASPPGHIVELIDFWFVSNSVRRAVNAVNQGIMLPKTFIKKFPAGLAEVIVAAATIILEAEG